MGTCSPRSRSIIWTEVSYTVVLPRSTRSNPGLEACYSHPTARVVWGLLVRLLKAMRDSCVIRNTFEERSPGRPRPYHYPLTTRLAWVSIRSVHVTMDQSSTATSTRRADRVYAGGRGCPLRGSPMRGITRVRGSGKVWRSVLQRSSNV